MGSNIKLIFYKEFLDLDVLVTKINLADKNCFYFNVTDIKKKKTITTRFFENELSSITIINKFPIITKILDKLINRSRPLKSGRNEKFESISDYITTEIFEQANNLTEELFNQIRNKPIIQNNFKFENFNLYETNRLEFVLFYYQMILKLLSIKAIIETKNPERIFITENLGTENLLIINSVAKQKDIKIERIQEKESTQKSFLKGLKYKLNLLIERIWYWRIWKIFNKKLISFKRFNNNSNKVIYLSHYKNYNSAIVEIIRAFKDSKNLTNILYTPHKLKSFALDRIRNSKLTGVETLLHSDSNYSKFKVRYNQLSNLLSKIVKSDDFNDIQFESINISSIIKYGFLHLYEKLVNSIRYLENINNILEKIQPKLLVLLAGNDALDALATRIAKKRKIPTINIPHALYAISYELFALEQDFIGCAGKKDKQFYISRGVDKEKLFIFGLPLFDKLYNKFSSLRSKEEIQNEIIKKYNLKQVKKIILLVTSHQEDYMRKLVFSSVVNAIKKHPEYTLIIKLHPLEEIRFYQDILVNFKDYHPLILKDVDLHELIIASDLIIGRDTGALIEAILLRKIVISLSYQSNLDFFNIKEFNVALTVYQPEKLEGVIENVLVDNNILDKLNTARENYIEALLYKFDGKASNRIKDFLSNKLNF